MASQLRVIVFSVESDNIFVTEDNGIFSSTIGNSSSADSIETLLSLYLAITLYLYSWSFSIVLSITF